jgi:hypothetical protein
MVDAEGAVLGEDRGDRVVDLLARREILAEGLFEADTDEAVGEARLAQALDGRLEQARRCRQEDREAARGVADLLGEVGKPFRMGDVERLIG